MAGAEGRDEGEELAFAQPDARRLPWLEADDDFDEPGAPGGRMATLAIVALLALAVLLGGAYWLLDRGADSAVVADGSTIEAPVGPYKTKPADPGGAEALGTGDTSFAVAEGRSPATRVAATETPAPVSDSGDDEPESSGGVGVQVGAYASRERAELGWQTLSGRHEALQGVSHRVVRGTVDGSTVFRLQAVAGSRAGARELCDRLKANGADCQVKN